MFADPRSVSGALMVLTGDAESRGGTNGSTEVAEEMTFTKAVSEGHVSSNAENIREQLVTPNSLHISTCYKNIPNEVGGLRL